MKRVAYISGVPLVMRDFQRFGMAAMIADGLSVDFIDATALINPSLKERASPETDTPGVTRHIANDVADLMSFAPVLASADFIVMLLGYTGDPNSIRVYRLLAKSRTPYLVLASNAFPGFLRYRDDGNGLLARIHDAAKRFKSKGLSPMRSILARIPKPFFGISAPAIIVFGGRESRKLASMFPIDDTTRSVNAHAMDYETFRALRSEHLEQSDIAVFVDEHMGFQRDMIAQNSEMPESPETFYPKLRAFFDRIERELSLNVVIAANPRSDYASKPGLFGDRKIVYGDTARLIGQSRIVLGHRSTALEYAFLFHRPLSLIATRRMYQHWAQKPAMDSYAKLLKKPILFIDDPDEADLSAALIVNDDNCDVFIADYVKSPDSADLPYWKIVLNAMRECVSA